MSSDPDPLDAIRCPKGCSTRFIGYLIWEGTDLRICDGRQEWMSANKGSKGVGGYEHVYNIGLRCSDCGTHYAGRNVPEATKNALDDRLSAVSHLLQDLVDQADSERMKKLLGDTAETMEDTG